jgi:hypothetical protein
MKMSISKLFLAVGLAAGFGIGIACSEAEDAVDCAQVCSRYDQCAKGDQKRTDCAAQCRDNAKDSDAFRDSLRKCEDCLDGENSCVGDVLSCTPACAGVILLSK